MKISTAMLILSQEIRGYVPHTFRLEKLKSPIQFATELFLKSEKILRNGKN